MAKLNAAKRKALPKNDFAVKSKASTAAGKAKGGSYPIPDENHARNALARASGKPVEAQVKAAVKAKYPQINVGGTSSVKARVQAAHARNK